MCKSIALFVSLALVVRYHKSSFLHVLLFHDMETSVSMDMTILV